MQQYSLQMWPDSSSSAQLSLPLHQKILPMPPNWTRVKKSLRGYWSQTSLEMACFVRPLHAPLMTTSLIVWWVNRCRHSLFSSLLSFAPSNRIQQLKICCRLELDRCNIYCMDKIPSNLGLLKNLQQLCCKLWPSLPSDVCHGMISFFNPLNEANGAWNGLPKKKKKTFQRQCELSLSHAISRPRSSLK